MPSNITISDLTSTIKEIVDGGSAATFIPHGVSMRPMLYGGRDEIILVKAELPLKKHDLPLYLRKNGAVVLHRVIKASTKDGKNHYMMRGDNTWELEGGITDQDIIAVVSRFKRKGKWYSVDSKGYRFYVKIWGTTYPMRWLVRFMWLLPGRAFRKIKRIIKGN